MAGEDPEPVETRGRVEEEACDARTSFEAVYRDSYSRLVGQDPPSRALLTTRGIAITTWRTVMCPPTLRWSADSKLSDTHAIRELVRIRFRECPWRCASVNRQCGRRRWVGRFGPGASGLTTFGGASVADTQRGQPSGSQPHPRT